MVARYGHVTEYAVNGHSVLLDDELGVDCDCGDFTYRHGVKDKWPRLGDRRGICKHIKLLARELEEKDMAKTKTVSHAIVQMARHEAKLVLGAFQLDIAKCESILNRSIQQVEDDTKLSDSVKERKTMVLAEAINQLRTQAEMLRSARSLPSAVAPKDSAVIKAIEPDLIEPEPQAAPAPDSELQAQEELDEEESERFPVVQEEGPSHSEEMPDPEYPIYD